MIYMHIMLDKRVVQMYRYLHSALNGLYPEDGFMPTAEDGAATVRVRDDPSVVRTP